ncbi:uncharacterized protein LOC135842768 [Planococcus citri]|uniref:uncharacterized protein LOC135842768 n=1 Tax=Planococcus citri TaxID=170843 RepID=UPI0031F8EDD7
MLKKLFFSTKYRPFRYIKMHLDERLWEANHRNAYKNGQGITGRSQVLCMVGVRYRIETLADDLYPEGLYNITATEAYRQILTSEDPKFANRSCIIVFRRRIKRYNISVEDFVSVMGEICASMTFKAASGISAFALTTLKYNDLGAIKRMFGILGISSNPDEVRIKAVQIVLEPLPMLPESEGPA